MAAAASMPTASAAGKNVGGGVTSAVRLADLLSQTLVGLVCLMGFPAQPHDLGVRARSPAVVQALLAADTSVLLPVFVMRSPRRIQDIGQGTRLRGVGAGDRFHGLVRGKQTLDQLLHAFRGRGLQPCEISQSRHLATRLRGCLVGLQDVVDGVEIPLAS